MESAKTGGKQWLAVALLGAATILFIALGKWQLDRAEEKRLLAASIAQNAALPPLELGASHTEGEVPQFRRIVVTGRFETDGRVFVGPRKLRGKNGYFVVTPFRLQDSDRRVLVNRGWVATGSGALPVVPVEKALQTIAGVADYPSPPALVLSDAEARRVWGDTWPYLTVEDYAETVRFPLLPMLVVMEPPEDSVFEQAWERKAPNPGMHSGYAIQWFAFAAIALGVMAWLVSGRKRRHG